MIHPDILAALTRERSGTFPPEPEPEPEPEAPLVLHDGSAVLIRQVHSTDAPLLADGFARLSPRSRWMRFLGAKTTLSAAELRYFTEVDHHDHEAIGALSSADGRGVGIARYIRDVDDPQAAEIAVTVVDDWQGRGLGTELLSRLSDRARQAGIHRFTALAAAENIAVAGLARKLGACLAGRGPGTVEYEIALVPAEYSLDWWFSLPSASPWAPSESPRAIGEPADAAPTPSFRGASSRR
jgi:RimJ/RimL family protein N-acetyltransferase